MIYFWNLLCLCNPNKRNYIGSSIKKNQRRPISKGDDFTYRLDIKYDVPLDR